VVASETSNNASIGGALIPLLTLGIPGDTVTAMLLGGLMMQGVIPGPMLFKNNGPLVYSIFGALFVASVMMLLVEFGGIRMFVRLLKIPKNILLSVVLCLCVVGAIASNNRLFDAYAMIAFGLLGYWLTKMRFPLPPLILGFILSPTLETNLRRGMQLSGGDFIPFLTRPISMVFLGIAMISFFGSIIHDIRRTTMNKKAQA
jgi:putative tricarboxylic transport membrane protein